MLKLLSWRLKIKMSEPFVLEVEHNGNLLQFETRLLQLGFTHKFSVLVDEVEIFFERDEEGGFRAIVPDGVDEKSKRRLDPSLLQSIAQTILSGLS